MKKHTEGIERDEEVKWDKDRGDIYNSFFVKIKSWHQIGNGKEHLHFREKTG